LYLLADVIGHILVMTEEIDMTGATGMTGTGDMTGMGDIITADKRSLAMRSTLNTG